MPAERAMLEAALDQLAADLRVLAGRLTCLDALEAYLDLARPLIDDCDSRDRLWVNARVEDIWSACPVVARRRAARFTRSATPTSREHLRGLFVDRAPGQAAMESAIRDTRAGARFKPH